MKKLFVTAFMAVLSVCAFGQNDLVVINNTAYDIYIDEGYLAEISPCAIGSGVAFSFLVSAGNTSSPFPHPGPASEDWGEVKIIETSSMCYAKTVNPTYTCLGTGSSDYTPCTGFTFSWYIMGGYQILEIN